MLDPACFSCQLLRWLLWLLIGHANRTRLPTGGLVNISSNAPFVLAKCLWSTLFEEWSRRCSVLHGWIVVLLYCCLSYLHCFGDRVGGQPFWLCRVKNCLTTIPSVFLLCTAIHIHLGKGVEVSLTLAFERFWLKGNPPASVWLTHIPPPCHHHYHHYHHYHHCHSMRFFCPWWILWKRPSRILNLWGNNEGFKLCRLQRDKFLAVYVADSTMSCCHYKVSQSVGIHLSVLPACAKDVSPGILWHSHTSRFLE